MKSSDYLYKLGNEIINAMRKDIANNSGKLSKSINRSVKTTMFGSELTISMLTYGKYVDSGTRGTKTGLANRKLPPIDSLKQWANSKNINVWALAKSIQMYGTKPHPFIYNFEAIILKHKQELIDIFGVDIDKTVKTLLKQTQWQSQN